MRFDAVVRSCLDDLSRRIDEQQESMILDAWQAFVDDRVGEGVFVPPPRTPRSAGVDWPRVHVNDAQHDPRAMLLAQFGMVNDALAGGHNGILSVRCNYGVGIMASQLGCEVIEMSREQGDLPTTVPLPSHDRLLAVLDQGLPDPRGGLGGKTLDMGELFLEVFEAYPVLKRWVRLYHPDCQSPMDNAELVWGSDIFMAFYDEPELVHRMLDLMVEHYLAFMRRWFALCPPRGDCSAHWGMWMRGQVMLRDDSLMNLSPAIYMDFVHDHERRVLDELGGGAIHFCGRGDHFIDAMTRMTSLTGINLSQPHLNDMEKIFQATVDRGKVIFGFNPDAVPPDRPMRGRLHCAVGPQGCRGGATLA